LEKDMAWIYLVVAGICEWGWPLGLKLGWTDKGAHAGWIIFSILSMALSGVLLLMAQRTIPMGTAYAVWTGIGAVGTFFIGIVVLSEPATIDRFFFVGLIVAGILGLRLASMN
jgi:quaternary ammonium compound-resistance protein SugE